jgi:hypothetical protein
MGTTLTGTTPQDTYDSLIKVTDNGPLSGTLKALSDGLGNDSTLSLSTTAASIAGTLAVAGASTFSSAITMALGGSPRLTLQDTDAGAGNVGILFQESTSPKWTLASVGGGFLFFNEATASNAISVSSTNNVGIGTSAIFYKLQANTESTGNAVIAGFVNPSAANNTTKGASISLGLADTAGDVKDAAYLRAFAGNANVTTGGLAIDVRKVDGTPTEIARFTPDGLTFNGDTAAANALDDYEEGTWTMGITFGGAAVGVTYAANTGTYTKVGRQVTVNGYLQLSNKGSSTGLSEITGLPFTIANTQGNWTAAGFRFNNITFATQMQAVGAQNTTTIILTQTNGATGVSANITDANFTNDGEIQFSLTYFV